MMDKKNNDIINELSGEDAKRILRILADEDGKTAARIDTLAEEFFETVDHLQISDSVFWELNSLNVEDLWDHSGKTRYGYVEPCDEAYNMVELVLDQYIAEYEKYIRLDKRHAAMEFMIGLIYGINEFDTNGRSEFRDWAEDIAGIFIQDYTEKFKNDSENAEFVDEFIQRLDELNAEGQDICGDIL
jgi:hypothetical protein